MKISRWVEPEANELHAEVIDITIPLQKNEKLGLELRNPNANEYTGLFIEKILQNSAAQMVSRVTCIFLKTIKIALGVEHNQFKIENIVSNEIAYFWEKVVQILTFQCDTNGIQIYSSHVIEFSAPGSNIFQDIWKKTWILLKM